MCADCRCHSFDRTFDAKKKKENVQKVIWVQKKERDYFEGRLDPFNRFLKGLCDVEKIAFKKVFISVKMLKNAY